VNLRKIIEIPIAAVTSSTHFIKSS